MLLFEKFGTDNQEIYPDTIAFTIINAEVAVAKTSVFTEMATLYKRTMTSENLVLKYFAGKVLAAYFFSDSGSGGRFEEAKLFVGVICNCSLPFNL